MNDGKLTRLLLSAQNLEDIHVLSSLTQDSILLVEDTKWFKKKHRFTLLLSRFKWELSQENREVEAQSQRCLSTLIFDNVTDVSCRGLENALENRILSLLTIEVEEGKNTDDLKIYLIFAGNTTIKLRVELIQAYLKDIVGTNRVSSKVVHGHEK
ncbi:MAG: DUF2948 family protein [Pseudomonadota bacterium]|nr:DUF2948 family protein [Pseudomonadota bacterium]